MKILMIAPEPVFQTRGTPFSVRDRCRCLSDLGHEVDLLTYPFGEDFDIPGVVIRRTRRIPGIRHVKIGFSWQKIPLDALLFVKALLALLRGGYDLIHTHEEAGMMGAVLKRLFKIPHLYDMHSSLPQQFENYETSTARPVLAFMRWAERVILKGSDAVIAICPHLRETALNAVPGTSVFVIENLAQGTDREPDPDVTRQLKEKYDLTDSFVFGYTGTFETNQGLEWLIEAFSIVPNTLDKAVLFLVGGEPDQIERVRSFAEQFRLSDRVRLPGKISPELMPEVMAACDVLVSPRRIGTNTPLKIYSYLRSGKPVLATRLLTHTQVLDDQTAVLVEPSPEGLAKGMVSLYNSPELRNNLGAAARRLEREKYSYPAYREKLNDLMKFLKNNDSINTQSANV